MIGGKESDYCQPAQYPYVRVCGAGRSTSRYAEEQFEVIFHVRIMRVLPGVDSRAKLKHKHPRAFSAIFAPFAAPVLASCQVMLLGRYLIVPHRAELPC